MLMADEMAAWSVLKLAETSAACWEADLVAQSAAVKVVQTAEMLAFSMAARMVDSLAGERVAWWVEMMA